MLAHARLKGQNQELKKAEIDFKKQICDEVQIFHLFSILTVIQNLGDMRFKDSRQQEMKRDKLTALARVACSMLISLVN